ncbi:MAG: CCA tRNA nucleotidyltransferase [Phycisphaerae bacterium]
MRPPLSIQDAALRVVKRLRQHEHQAFWAGGSVRDMLLGREPTDIDVATDALPDTIIKLFTRTRKVGAKFGVVMVRQGPYWIETATFRSDLDYHDGRHPEKVVFTTAEEDAQRRDFTINGLFYDPISNQVIDYVGGRKDLEAGIIRAIGNPARRFAEDHLRMLRAVRFSARLGFPIEPDTTAAIREQAEHISRISPERIREELEKMLSHPARAEAVRQMAELGLLDHLWPNTRWSPDRVADSIRVLSRLPEKAGFVLGMAALLNAYPPASVRQMARDLRCSNHQSDRIAWLIEHLDDIHHAEVLCLPAMKMLIAHEGFEELLELHKAVCLARGLPLDGNEVARRRKASIPPEEVAPPPFVTGDDLIAAGLQPGPRFREILDRLYDEQLDDRLMSRDQAMARMRELLAGTAGEHGHRHQ